MDIRYVLEIHNVNEVVQDSHHVYTWSLRHLEVP